MITNVILFLLFYSLLTFASDDNRIGTVVRINNVPGIIIDCEKSRTDDQCWIPEISIVEKGEKNLFAFAKAETIKRSQRLRHPFFEYHRSYRGTVWRKRRVVHIKGFHRSLEEVKNGRYLIDDFSIMDGGYSYFKAVYDPDKDEFIDFRFSGGS